MISQLNSSRSVSASILAALLVVASAGAVKAAPVGPFEDTFLGMCVIPEAAFDVVESIAKVSKWPPAPEEALPMLRPQSPPKKFSAWMITGEADPLVAAASIGDYGGADVPVCALAGRTHVADLKDALAKLGAKSIGSQDDVVQMTELFELDRGSNKLLVSIVYSPKETFGVVMASVSDLPEAFFSQ